MLDGDPQLLRHGSGEAHGSRGRGAYVGAGRRSILDTPLAAAVRRSGRPERFRDRRGYRRLQHSIGEGGRREDDRPEDEQRDHEGDEDDGTAHAATP